MAIIPTSSLPLLLFLSFFLSLTSSSLNSDGLALLALKSAIKFDPTRSLSDWSDSDDNPCRWTGITCASGQVVAINLPDRRLSGYIPSEVVGGAIPTLRRLHLPNNNFSGPIPPSISSSLYLQRIVLSANSLSGNIPPAIGNLTALVQLDLSENLLSGIIPPGLGELAMLTGTLNLSYNRLSGAVPASLGDLPVAVSLDVRHNNLTGPIPLRGSLVNQGPTAFAGNPLLCGFPLQNLCTAASNSIPPPQSASSNFPKKSNSPPADHDTNRSWAATAYSGASAVLAAAAVAISVAFVWWWSKGDGSSDQVWKKKNEQMDRKGGGGGGTKSEDKSSDTEVDSRFCVLDSEDDKDGGGLGGIEMEDLLRASAYVVGKGSMGIVYKVVLARAAANGTQSVAVRRLAEGGWQKLKDFDAEVQAIGRIEHPNLVRLRAYYWAPDEKLLIYDYIANGTLYSALHGRSPTAPALTWETRLKIARGIARGLSFLHDCSTRKYVHGNLKTSNVLLDHQNNPKISDFGLRRLVNNIQDSSSDPSPVATLPPPVQSSSFTTNDNIISNHCCNSAPEAHSRGGTTGHVTSKPTQRWDVYSFGVVIMELLTGQSPASFRHNHKLKRKDKEEVEGKEVEEEEEVVVLEEWVRKMFHERRPMTEIVDPGLLQEVSARKEVVALFHLALACTTRDPESRPRMKSVSEVLDRMGQPASLG